MLNNGLYDLDPRKLAALVTFLVHDLAGVCEAPGLPEGYRLERLGAPDFARYCTVYRAVGEDWLWFSRLRMPEEELWQILHASKVHALELLGPEGAVGLLELDFRDEKTPELAFFGLVPGAVGLGLGKALMGEALIAKVLAVGGVRALSRAAPPPPAAPVASPYVRAPASPITPMARPAAPATPAPVTPIRSPLAAHTPPVERGGAVRLRNLERIRPKIVVIGASTGGPQALVSVLAKMKSAISRVPVVIAQHMPPIFGAIFASHLKQHAGLPAVEAMDGKPLAPGTIYLAPGGCHTVVRRKPDGQFVIAMLPSEAG